MKSRARPSRESRQAGRSLPVGVPLNGVEHRHFAGMAQPPAECGDDRPPRQQLGRETAADSDPANDEFDRSKTINSPVRGPRPPAASPAHPGERLRAAREARGISLDEVSRATKINASLLTALEAGDVEHLPAIIFTRGFLKAYAREVGLDPDETADFYLAQVAPDSLLVEGAEARLKVASPAARSEVLAFDEDTSKFLADRQVGRVGWLVTVAAMVGLVVYVWSFNWQDSRPISPAVDLMRDGAVDAAPAGAASTSVEDAAPAIAGVETPLGSLRFELRPHGPCWLAAAADGTPVFARLLQPGDQETIEIHDELILRVGDPGALTFFINGRPGRTLGEPGEPVNVRITKDNFRQFLGS